VRGWLRAALVLSAVAMHSSLAQAGVRPPAVRGALTDQGESIALVIEASNAGGSPLHQVFPRLRIADRLVELAAEPELAIGETARWKHRFRRQELGGPRESEGVVLVRIHYQDGTAYPLSVPLVLTLEGSLDPAPSGLVRGALEVDGSSARPHVALTLENAGQEDAEGVVTFFSSIELVARPEQSPFRVEAGQEIRLAADLHVDGALAGPHTIYAVARVAGSRGAVLVLSKPFQVTQDMVKRPPIQTRAAGLAVVLAALFLATSLLELRALRSSKVRTG